MRNLSGDLVKLLSTLHGGNYAQNIGSIQLDDACKMESILPQSV